MTVLETRSTERSQRAGRRARREASGGIPGGRATWRHLTSPLEPQRAFSDDQIAAIHEAALRMLEELGIRVLSQRAIDLFRRGGARIVSPFTLIGAMAPVTIAGALTLQHAEALAGITLSQLTRPGTRSSMARSPRMST